jgi:hypothetical protein
MHADAGWLVVDQADPLIFSHCIWIRLNWIGVAVLCNLTSLLCLYCYNNSYEANYISQHYTIALRPYTTISLTKEG